MDNTGGENPPADWYQSAEHRRKKGQQIRTAATVEIRHPSERDADEGCCKGDRDEDLGPEVAGVFFEDVEDLTHASVPFWVDVLLAMARKIDRRVMGVRVMSRALGKICASSVAAAPLAASV